MAGCTDRRGSEMENDCEIDKVSKALLKYAQRRRYLVPAKECSQEDASQPEGAKGSNPMLKPTKAALISQLKAYSKLNAISYKTTIRNVAQAEQQFALLRTWVAEMQDYHCQNDLTPLLMPLLCHLYLDSLKLNDKLLCANFLKRQCATIINDEWYPFVELLLSPHLPQEGTTYPLINTFRTSKLELRLKPFSLQLLRRFLATKSLSILIPALHHWFNVKLLTEDALNNETEEPSSKDDASAESGKREEENENVLRTKVYDKEMQDLIKEINAKRQQPTPPPPLLLYTTHKTEGIVCGRVSVERKLAATGDNKSEVRIWGLGETKHTPRLHESYYWSVPIGAYTEYCTEPETQSENRVWSLRGHCDTVYDVAFLSNTNYLTSVSFDCTMRLWKLSDFSCTAVYRGHSSPIWGVAVSPMCNYVATASNDKTARLWCLDRTFPVRIMAGHLQDVTCVAFHPNGSYIATGSPDRTVRLWSITDGSLVRVTGGHKGLGSIAAVAFSPNGQFVASAGNDNYIWIWDLQSGSLATKLTGHKSRIVSIDWSNEGSTLSAATFDGTIFLWPLDIIPKSSEEVQPKIYSTKCSNLLSVQYNTKNTLVSLGLF